MDGTIPKRPHHIPKYTPLTVERDNFMMDFENACLSENWGKGAHPKGPRRHKNQEWAEMIQLQVFPHHSDIDWHEYSEWVTNGGGDDFFQEDE